MRRPAATEGARQHMQPRSVRASECVPDANFDRVRGILISGQNPRQPIAFVVLEQQDLVVVRAAQITVELEIRANRDVYSDGAASRRIQPARGLTVGID